MKGSQERVEVSRKMIEVKWEILFISAGSDPIYCN
jgi:hypothetical protein